LLNLSRSGFYYDPVGEREDNLLFMRLIDEQYTRTPFYGSRKLTQWLMGLGYTVNRKRVQRLMAIMGIHAICPMPNTSIPKKEHAKYPYLLRNLKVIRPMQVWCTDITYVRLQSTFAYVVAVMDWYSRYVLAWKISDTMETTFCIETLEQALKQGKPEIFNSDQGSQFTSFSFTEKLISRDIAISMDGRGRAADNIFIERFWRTLKYEEVYLKDYIDMADANNQLAHYVAFYNNERPHQSLGYRTPKQVHFSPFTAQKS